MKKLLLLIVMATAVACFAGRNFAGSDIIAVPVAQGSALDICSNNAGCSSVDTNGNLTVSVWIYPTSVGDTEHDPISRWAPGTAGNTAEQWLISIGATAFEPINTIGFKVGNGGALTGVYGNCSTAVTANQWYQVILEVDTVFGAAEFFVPQLNCAISTGWREQRNPTGIALTIGGQTGSGGTGTAPNFKGRVANIGIWNAVLSAGERTALEAGVAPNRIRQTNLVYYCPLYGFSSPEPDLSGHQYNGAVTGTTAAPQCPCAEPQDR
jgi:hypothetical protein